MNTSLTRTENGALQLKSSGNKCLDLFEQIGSTRSLAKDSPETLRDLFLDAYKEDPVTATLVMYWVRSPREGAGEREVFHVLHKVLHGLSPKTVIDNLPALASIGYYKDLLRVAQDMPETADIVVELFASGVKEGNHYACKWLPRGTKLWADVRKKLGMTNKEFRKFVSEHGRTVEQQLASKQISEIKYSAVPSLAMNRYKNLFLKQDRERFLHKIKTEKINASVLYPHQVFPYLYYSDSAYSDDVKEVIKAQWAALPDCINSANGILTVLDTSGSMGWESYAPGRKTPREIANPLALYCAEKIGAPFKDQVIVFSSQPSWINLADCDDVVQKMTKLMNWNDYSNTDLYKTFELILDKAKEVNLPPDKMPGCVLILSDMQFDRGVDKQSVTLMDSIRDQFKYAGYPFPTIVYWNLACTNTGVADNENCALISGFSPRIMQSVLACKTDDARKVVDPVEVMNTALEPIRKMVNLEHITPLPSALKQVDFNPTRGQSARRKVIVCRIENPSNEKEFNGFAHI